MSTLNSYDSTAEEYSRRTADMHPKEEAEKFLKLLPPNPKIVDLGCGSGRDAKIFSEKNYSVTGIDFSPKMLEIANRDAPKANFLLMDLTTLSFPANSFDGAWANASFLHIPKNSIVDTLNGVYKLLKVGGYFYIKVKEGSGEVIERDERYGVDKFWSYFQPKEFEALLTNAGFHIVEIYTTVKSSSYQTHPYLHAFCKKGS